METKVCRRCTCEKLVSEFYPGPRYRDKLYPWCKACHKAWREESRDKRNAQMREWHQKQRQDPEWVAQTRANSLAFYHADAERKERINVARRKREQYRWRTDPSYRARKDRQKAESIERRKNDPTYLDNRRIWSRLTRHRRRAHVLGSGGSFTRQEWQQVCEQYDHRCACCGKKSKLTADHVIPLSRGGLNTIENIQPLCKSCNCRKHVKKTDYRTKNLEQSVMEWGD